MRPLSSHAYNQRRDELFGRCDRLGRVDLHDLGENRRVRKLVIDLVVPGQAGAVSLPDEAHFRYQEWWRRSSVGWVRFRYDYDYFDLRDGGHRGYHLHPLAGRGSVPHAVYVLPNGSGSGRHYVAHEVELVAAHEEFEAQYTVGRPIDCRGVRAID